MRNTPHGEHQAMIQDKAGNPWCDNCVLQHDLMNIGHERNYPPVEVASEGKHTLKIKAGYDAWLTFCKTMGKASIQRVLAIVEVNV